jgi:hypothetical protein
MQIKTRLTRDDCERDDVKVFCPNATTLGFAGRFAKRGYWVQCAQNGVNHQGRIIGRVTCERKIYVEVAVASPCFSYVCVRWFEPHEVCEIRRAVPRKVFEFFARDNWEPREVFAALDYGVSDLADQKKLHEQFAIDKSEKRLASAFAAACVPFNVPPSPVPPSPVPPSPVPPSPVPPSPVPRSSIKPSGADHE